MANLWSLTKCRNVTIFISTVLLLSLPVLYRILTHGVQPIIATQAQTTSYTPEVNGTFLTTPYALEPNGIFSRRLSDAQRDTIMNMFKKLLHACTFNNITMFLYAGSMIGSYRHHGMIPWDHDIDVITNGSQRQLTWDSINNITGLNLRNYSLTIWKLYSSSEYGNPFIDIYFFTENSTHIYDDNYSIAYWQRKELVFPLQMRPFGTELAPVPCNIVEYIKRAYSDPIDQCPYIFIRHGGTIDRMVPCSALYEKYEFVHRSHVSDGVVLEELRHGQEKIQTFTLPDFC